jgi:hypothetical protein
LLQNILQTVIQQGVVVNNPTNSNENGNENENQDTNEEEEEDDEEEEQEREVQIVFGFQTANAEVTAPPATERVMTLGDTNRYTELFVYQHLNENLEDICSICRQSFDDQEICRRIKRCQHFFHCACVDAWIIRHPTCPMCRDEIASP